MEARQSASPVGDLHVFVFEDISDSPPEASEPEVFESDEVDLPVKISEAALGSVTGFGGRISGLPEKIRYLDVHSFKVQGKIKEGTRWEKRENRFARLDYKIRIVEWREEGFVLELEMRFQREKWHLERISSRNSSRTTIIRLNGTPPLVLPLAGWAERFKDAPLETSTRAGNPLSNLPRY